MESFSRLIWQGKLPFNKKYLSWLFFYIFPLLSLSSLMVEGVHGAIEMGEWSLYLFLAILLISPIKTLLPKLGLMRLLYVLRKEFGVLCFWLAMFHGGTLLYVNGLLYFANFSSIISVQNGFFWGFLAFVGIFLLGITSNNYSLRLLKKWWKVLHWIVYPTFIFIILHVILFKPAEEMFLMGMFVLYLILKLAAISKQEILRILAAKKG